MHPHPALKLLQKIPRGKVVSYKEFARAVGTSPRGAASILAHNKELSRYPCYKVVSVNGELRGYSGPGGLARKRALLDAEGVDFTEAGTVSVDSFHYFSP